MNILETIADFLFPPVCPSCGAYVEKNGDWCQACLANTIKIHELPIEKENYKYFHRIWALGRYHGVLRKLIIKLKYNKKTSVLPQFDSFITAAMDNFAMPSDIDAVAFVPLHDKRRKERGFNQTELIFRKILDIYQLSPIDCLERVICTKAQFSLTREERKENLYKAFAIKPGYTIKAKNCLLLDDIYTTGTTMAACAKVLKKNGAGKIYGIVLASDA
ncbi:ComF family protein [Pectinatus sottacetonis]|uniref:ComF family protein n=1 Tax=Pectinatus sottacetonis TaxID=1002795 RepID=UPI0018C4BE02|nr:ComF family protein [Pectinatus sottacetonis]